MNSTLRNRIAKGIGAGALSVALLSTGTAGAFAASPGAASPKPKPISASPSHATDSASASSKPGKKSPSPKTSDTGPSSKPGEKSPSSKPNGKSPSPTGGGSITIKASKSQVRAGQSVTFTGRAKGLKVGTKVQLQHMHKGKWTSLQASTTLKKGSSYSLNAKLNTKGKEQLRIMADKAVSPTVTVTVK